ncbi:MAG TPA: exodeoxyribonuclease VII small subunit [Erysipelotrichaceae bacterium]|nr:exodeoxyribonuclease VII small subunit [Solobacterium sp.]HAE16932.1 exodeoxyribonuclease VII small subunit [Erysipelotrichaceae bacterium]
MAKKELTFEESMDRLDEIVSLLEENEQPLNQSIDLFEEGLKLVRHCDDMLKKFEERIEEIKSRNGGAEDEEL